MFRKRKDVFVIPGLNHTENTGGGVPAVTLLSVGPAPDRSPVRRPWYAGGRHGIPGFPFHRKTSRAAWRISRSLRTRCSHDSGVEVSSSAPPSPGTAVVVVAAANDNDDADDNDPAVTTAPLRHRNGAPGSVSGSVDGLPVAVLSDLPGGRRPSARPRRGRKAAGKYPRGHESGEAQRLELVDEDGVRKPSVQSEDEVASGASSDRKPTLGDSQVAGRRHRETGEHRMGVETERPLKEKSADCTDGPHERRVQVKAAAAVGVGMGLCHLDQLCRLMEKMGHLNEANRRLQQQLVHLQSDLQAQRFQQGLLLSACQCGTRAWVQQHWLSLAQSPGSAGPRLRSHSDVAAETLGAAVHRQRPPPGAAGMPRRSCSVNTHGHVDAALMEKDRGSIAPKKHVLNSLP
ncbi:uncharacterized protein LOC116950954 isoform X2 [Petromyzon marinus]|uniref:Uncharacterized protein LOC116950954 isoform X2 n=1 Tax=Petromyzon marinus TaxID=7757 RepID=A0AAJ7TVV2_PETMA|nr:uncharacterized protein LOC116950954 isoform X2 [Petromyzon marinus]